MRGRVAPFVLALALAGCSSGDEGSTTVLDVSAAASLKATFTKIAADFEAEHEGVDVRLTFAGSSDLAAQIDQGAPADVFAAADEATMSRVAVEGPATPFATNTLTIVTEPGNPLQIRSLRDLSREDVDLVVCAPQVPCGAATQEQARQAGVSLSPRSEESAVTDVLGKVRSGEADAGLVYVTDAKGAGPAVTTVPLEGAGRVVNHYPIAVVQGSDEAELAGRFRDAVLADPAQQVLRDAGFGPP